MCGTWSCVFVCPEMETGCVFPEIYLPVCDETMSYTTAQPAGHGDVINVGRLFGVRALGLNGIWSAD